MAATTTNQSPDTTMTTTTTNTTNNNEFPDTTLTMITTNQPRDPAQNEGMTIVIGSIPPPLQGPGGELEVISHSLTETLVSIASIDRLQAKHSRRIRAAITELVVPQLLLTRVSKTYKGAADLRKQHAELCESGLELAKSADAPAAKIGREWRLDAYNQMREDTKHVVHDDRHGVSAYLRNRRWVTHSAGMHSPPTMFNVHRFNIAHHARFIHPVNPAIQSSPMMIIFKPADTPPACIHQLRPMCPGNLSIAELTRQLDCLQAVKAAESAEFLAITLELTRLMRQEDVMRDVQHAIERIDASKYNGRGSFLYSDNIMPKYTPRITAELKAMDTMKETLFFKRNLVSDDLALATSSIKVVRRVLEIRANGASNVVRKAIPGRVGAFWEI